MSSDRARNIQNQDQGLDGRKLFKNKVDFVVCEILDDLTLDLAEMKRCSL